MRIHLKTTANENLVPFNYQNKIVGTLHKWLGENEEHNLMSLYSFSWLHGSVREQNGLNFPKGASWFISFYDAIKVKKIVLDIQKNPEMFAGMRVVDVVIEETPDLSSRELFYLGSPIFIKRAVTPGGEIKYYTFNDVQSAELMTKTLIHKMEIAGLPLDETLDISFDLTYAKKKIKFINYRGIRNKANLCPVYIKGKPETKAFAWNVGIGNSTGIGFGSIY